MLVLLQKQVKGLNQEVKALVAVRKATNGQEAFVLACCLLSRNNSERIIDDSWAEAMPLLIDCSVIVTQNDRMAELSVLANAVGL